MLPSRARAFLADSFFNGLSIYWTLVKITLPLLVAVRVLDAQFDIISKSGDALAPLMGLVGLPGDTAIVFATALFFQIYAATLVLAGMWAQLELSTAQLTILFAMILTAHALPVELRIVQKAGMPLAHALLLRVLGAFALGGLLHLLYGDTHLQEPGALPFVPDAPDASWGGWLLGQLHNWAVIFLIIQLLVLFVNLMRVTHAERALIALLEKPLQLIGIGGSAVTMAMIGLLLGLSYGGGMLIEEGRSGRVRRRDMLCALSLLCLCHSLIEDTLLVMYFGAHISGVLFARVLFAILVVAGIHFMLRRAAAPSGAC